LGAQISTGVKNGGSLQVLGLWQSPAPEAAVGLLCVGRVAPCSEALSSTRNDQLQGGHEEDIRLGIDDLEHGSYQVKWSVYSNQPTAALSLFVLSA
jgi:hypothetical protein